MLAVAVPDVTRNGPLHLFSSVVVTVSVRLAGRVHGSADTVGAAVVGAAGASEDSLKARKPKRGWAAQH